MAKKLDLNLQRNEQSIKNIYNGTEEEMNSNLKEIASISSNKDMELINNTVLKEFNASY